MAATKVGLKVSMKADQTAELLVAAKAESKVVAMAVKRAAVKAD